DLLEVDSSAAGDGAEIQIAVIGAIGAFQLDAGADEVVADRAAENVAGVPRSVRLERAAAEWRNRDCAVERAVEDPVQAAFEANVDASRLERLRLGSERCRREKRCTNDHPLHLVSPRLCCLLGALTTNYGGIYTILGPPQQSRGN